MLRAAVSLLVLFALYAVISAAPQRTERKNVVDFFPTEVGTHWTYGTVGGEVTQFVHDAENDGEAKVVTIYQVHPRKPPYMVQRLRVSDRGVFEIATYVGEIEPPHCLLRLPHRPGNRWTYDRRPETRALWFDREEAVAREEEVVVPAGRYSAIRVDSEHQKDGKPAETHTTWYAPRVGPVKWVDGGSRSIVLKSFRPGTR